MEEINQSSTIVYLSLGSNQGERLEYLQQAKDLIQQKTGEIIAVSGVCETPPVGFEAETYFYNLCLSVRTNLAPLEILEQLKEIENLLGRQKKTILNENGERIYSSRVIDIDIILHGDLILESTILSIPHPRFRDRNFVLIPLNEIASQIVDPVTNQTINELLLNCESNVGDIRFLTSVIR